MQTFVSNNLQLVYVLTFLFIVATCRTADALC
jgi:hypothetical protein